MQLFEFFNAVDDARYQSDKDVTAYDMQGDTRKSRLTLEMLNQLRMHMQARREEKQAATEIYKKMYGGSVADSAELA